VKDIVIDFHPHASNTTSDHFPAVSVISIKSRQNSIGKNTHWKVFSLFTEYSNSFWEMRWQAGNLNETYNDYIKFLSLLAARFTTSFPLNRYRVAIPAYLRSFMAYVRARSFRAARTKSMHLVNEVRSLRKEAKKELNKFRSAHLKATLKLRNTSSPSAVAFWKSTKRFLKPSSSLHAFIDESEKMIKDAEEMCATAANYYEEFFKQHDVTRPHPYKTRCLSPLTTTMRKSQK
jgi:hypothetical protein